MYDTDQAIMKRFKWVMIAVALVSTAAGLLRGMTEHREERLAVSQSYLSEIAQDLNEHLPKMLDENIRQDPVTVEPGKRLVYHYTLVHDSVAQMDRKKLAAGRASAAAQIKPRVCSLFNKELQKGVTFVTEYGDRDGKPVAEIVVAANDCQQP